MPKPKTVPAPRPAVTGEAATVPGSTREAIRLAIIELTRTKQPIANVAVRRLARVDQGATALVVREYKAGRMPPVYQPWDTTGPSAAALIAADSLQTRVRAATTDSDREQLAHEVAALVAAGELDPGCAREIRAALTEARQAARQKRESEPPPPDPTRYVLASAQAVQVGRALDWIVSEERRARVVAFIEAELAADLAAHPNTDQGGALPALPGAVGQ